MNELSPGTGKSAPAGTGGAVTAARGNRSAERADDTFRRRYAERIGADESTLVDHAVLDPAATVAHDVGLLRSAPAISPRVTVSGHVYDVVTGLVETVVRV